ncbi:hypothetical protein FACS1894208_04430 [Clostridia bacterium]|nr:hypothetical protein FACS1894208_04430 [Clostridia bacterium]
MRESGKLQVTVILAVSVFFLLLLGVVTVMTLKNTSDLSDILEESVKSQLISISVAAREIIDTDKFESYNSMADAEADAENYNRTLTQLRKLQSEVGAKYIYALKQMNGKYYFIFDTDAEDEEVFIEYELSPVHEHAFVGRDSADILNVDDIYGTYNTGAVPIWKNGKVIGVVSTDIEDEYMGSSASTASANAVSLIVTVVATMGLMFFVVFALARRVKTMQDKLYRMANYDTLTGLPNRQYLMSYLREISVSKKSMNSHFAMLFIDLDNFKQVNDGAGHDAGDELLRHIADYLQNVHKGSQAFRPSAGILNVSARVGGDEFVQIVPGVGDETEAAIVAQKILDNFRTQAMDRFIEKYQVGLSIGVALFPYHSTNYNVLIKYADIAMYHAKRGGKNSYRVYNEDMGSKDEK